MWAAICLRSVRALEPSLRPKQSEWKRQLPSAGWRTTRAECRISTGPELSPSCFLPRTASGCLSRAFLNHGQHSVACGPSHLSHLHASAASAALVVALAPPLASLALELHILLSPLARWSLKDALERLEEQQAEERPTSERPTSEPATLALLLGQLACESALQHRSSVLRPEPMAEEGTLARECSSRPSAARLRGAVAWYRESREASARACGNVDDGADGSCGSRPRNLGI
mmetsp:Transcript_40560/g.94709  ORF Transcript_40560/g.94709 Transcript_40560/m.94709 type:complete len:231 (+) Transcript_40560:976-1668(+)